MSGSFPWLPNLFTTPAADLSGTLSKPSIVSKTLNAFSAPDSNLDSILAAATMAQVGEQIGVNNLVISGVNKATDSNGKSYNFSYSYGIPSIQQSLNTNNSLVKTSLIFDETDQMDYNNRYISVDASIRKNDASDIAFFRIVKANDNPSMGWKKYDQVFPNYSSYIAPGLSKQKFRQFIVLSIHENSQERMQMVETSDDFQLLFYGKHPEILQIQGILKNTIDNPWNMNMVFMWDNLMRGTKLAEQGNILQVYIDGDLYSGYPFGFQRSKAAPNDFIVNFSFSFVIKDKITRDNLSISLNDVASSISEYGLWGKMI